MPRTRCRACSTLDTARAARARAPELGTADLALDLARGINCGGRTFGVPDHVIASHRLLGPVSNNGRSPTPFVGQDEADGLQRFGQSVPATSPAKAGFESGACPSAAAACSVSARPFRRQHHPLGTKRQWSTTRAYGTGFCALVADACEPPCNDDHTPQCP